MSITSTIRPTTDESDPTGTLGLLGRVAATLLVLALAWAMWGSAMDRAALQRPALADYVPDLFQVRSTPNRVAIKVGDRNPERAIAPLMQAVASDPIDYRLLSALGRTLIISGQDNAAFDIFRASAALGWRDNATQAYWLQSALIAGEWEMAVLRLDGLLRDNPDLPEMAELLKPFESEPEGRMVLLERLALEPEWLTSYLNAERDVDDATLIRRVPVLRQFAKSGHVLGCDRIAPLVRAMIARGHGVEASLVQQAHCAGATPLDGLGDAKLSRSVLDRAEDPFAWRLVPGASLAVRDGIEGGLVLSNEGSTAIEALAKPVRFVPGSTVRIAIDGAAADIGLALDCSSAARPDFSGGSTRALTVPACATQTLRLWLKANARDVKLSGLVQSR